ncbi:hypothetical protein [Acidiferrobacter thiooxydans]|uniref:hypothetical protein n=1 Tax=Acidiferrobacter thiooxydans TaxID=163359 RepID=UPI000DF1F82C|nr:hypothetical protein [Acidiferrobacter thiooxydans]
MSVKGLIGGNVDGTTLFTAVFALYFAANIASARSYSAFDTAAMVGGDGRACGRFLVGTAFLNVAPTFYYLWILGKIERFPRLNPPYCTLMQFKWEILILLLGMVGAGFYRIFAGCLAIRTDGDRFFFYAADDPGQKNGNEYNKRGHSVRPGCGAVRGEIGAREHFCGSLLYFLPPFLLYYAIVK